MSTNQASEDIIAETTAAANVLFQRAQESFIYRASIAYVLQSIKSFIAAIQPFQTSSLDQLETQSFQRFIGIVNHFSGNLLPSINKSMWKAWILDWKSTYVHEYIFKFRETMKEICKNLKLDESKVIVYEPNQDAVNKNADFQHLKKVLRDAREQAISVKNSVDVQQSIEVRLRSIQSHLPKGKSGGKVQHHPSSETLPIGDLQQRMDKELSIFKEYDIPVDDLRLDVALGCGGFGTVFKATRLSTAELLAVKEVRSDKLSMSTWASLYSEVATMSDLRHRYVLELVGAHIKEPYRIITRFCPGKSLFDRLHRTQSPLSPQRLTMIAYQVAEGMRFLHAHGIVHRDLKTMNILLDENDAAKIADFGLAGMMKDQNEVLIGGVGTPHYTAPEVLERKRYGPKVDTYSYGIILWEMAVRQIPFRDKTHQEIYDHVVSHCWRLPTNGTMPEPLKKLITRCWSQNPNDRPEFQEIVELFESGKIFFKGCERLNRSSLECPEVCPPLDINYLTTILSNPSDDNFPKVVDFLESHIDFHIKTVLHQAKVMSHYNSTCMNTASILIIASEILEPNEFPKFIEETGNAIIKEIMQYTHAPSLIAVAKFCLKVPDALFHTVKGYVPMLVERMDQVGLPPLILRLLARLEVSEIKKFRTEIVAFFNPKGIDQVNDQKTIDALSTLIPIIADMLTVAQFEACIPLIEMEFDCPVSLIQLLIDKTGEHSAVRLLLAVVRAASRTEVTDCLTRVLQHCQPPEIRSVAYDLVIFDQIQKLLEEKKSVETALLLLFRLSTDKEVPTLLANHSLLHSVLQLEGHVAQRLQIFTALFSVEQFCSDTTISDGVLKLLVSSLDDEKLTVYSMKLIGALSSHNSGCTLIAGNGMLSLFSQMFLSSSCGDMSTALTILSNFSTKQQQQQEIPQLSLIISCLMQDLIYSSSNKSEILHTLINLIKLSPSSVQEHDLQNSVLPLLSQRQEPVIIVLVMKLFDECEMTKLRNFYQQIAQKVFNILTMDSMMYPVLLSSALQLIASVAMQYNLRKFIVQTDLINFFKDIAEQVVEDEETYQDITNCIYCLTRALDEQKNKDMFNMNNNEDNENNEYNQEEFEEEEEFAEEEEEVDRMPINKKVSQFNVPIGKVANLNMNQSLNQNTNQNITQNMNRVPLRSTIANNKSMDDEDESNNDDKNKNANDLMKNVEKLTKEIEANAKSSADISTTASNEDFNPKENKEKKDRNLDNGKNKNKEVENYFAPDEEEFPESGDSSSETSSNEDSSSLVDSEFSGSKSFSKSTSGKETTEDDKEENKKIEVKEKEVEVKSNADEKVDDESESEKSSSSSSASSSVSSSNSKSSSSSAPNE